VVSVSKMICRIITELIGLMVCYVLLMKMASFW